MDESILITGGAGYIGSHTCVELLNAGFSVTVFDNYCNSKPEALNRVESITGKSLTRVQGDVRDRVALEAALRSSGASAVIHFAGLKAVGESGEQPLRYYDNNVVGTLRLLEAMQTCGVKTLVFSSSATVYGAPQFLPYSEDHPFAPTNPYGRTKLMVEDILRDAFASDDSWRFSILRYFNPVGAHASGLIGEDPQGVPNNLMPLWLQVAVGRRECLNVFGDDYDTPDGTGVRDYIHVTDLAEGHVRALQWMAQSDGGLCRAFNLGAGVGYSVLEMVRAFEAASGKPIPYRIQPRRAGDLAGFHANADSARSVLGWQVTRDLQTMCADTWRWQSNNPSGYVG
ncbi:UDP-glucose 4-epimerase GalE [Rhodoferax sp. AJA081-3]|uniref:UDP-glucose 4-epimerase GalE n=1 Tax=Rhodoferax sp. AJA081-3 TaxID=2752316 RepID=UPI001AE0AE61|nr:UDP-glucose 4-epimerase GalE [Rhodoferax sp. AJA081-3]QTN26862.1 UDP-glucose 4-epimerase GalE [Rhodoferax sp. AJA081-3]